MSTNEHLINDLVTDWDEVYKKGQLTLWVLLAILDGKKYAQEITVFMNQATNGHLNVKEQSLYRALRRFTSLGLVSVSKEASPGGGPDRKYYRLTETGRAVLQKFITMHIEPLLTPSTRTLLETISKESL